MTNTDYELIDNTDLKRFEMHVDGHIALLEYILKPDKIYLIHTEVPPAIGNLGIVSKLVKKVLEEVDRRGLKVVPACSFVDIYIKRHPEWRKLL
jgi:predicted GNAT family acetyltransferase